MTSNKILKLNAVKEKTGLSRSTIYSFMSHKIFPPQIKLGLRSVGWLEHEIDDWLAQRILQSRTLPVEVA